MSKFRLSVDGLTTQWYDEDSRMAIARKVEQLRAAHGPEARISVQRDVALPRKPQEWVRFQLTYKDGTVQFSNPMLKTEAEAVGVELARDYPDATITQQEWVK